MADDRGTWGGQEGRGKGEDPGGPVSDLSRSFFFCLFTPTYLYEQQA